MPIEERTIQPHTINDKHLLVVRQGLVQQIVQAAPEQEQSIPTETLLARLAAEPGTMPSGLSPIDGVTPVAGNIIWHIGDARLYAASTGPWTPTSIQPSAGDLVMIAEGTRHAGTLHYVISPGERVAVHHSTVIVRGQLIGPDVVTTNPSPVSADALSTVIGGAELTSLDPVTYTVRVAGIYHVSVMLQGVYSGPDTMMLYCYINGAEAAYYDRRQTDVTNTITLSGHALVRATSGDTITIRVAKLVGGPNLLISAATDNRIQVYITRVM
jgi:hypothetical protein